MSNRNKTVGEPRALFALTCPHCKEKFTVHLTRSEMKRYLKNMDREARKRRRTVRD